MTDFIAMKVEIQTVVLTSRIIISEKRPKFGRRLTERTTIPPYF